MRLLLRFSWPGGVGYGRKKTRSGGDCFRHRVGEERTPDRKWKGPPRDAHKQQNESNIKKAAGRHGTG